jgi:large subunit ribosomal protein L18
MNKNLKRVHRSKKVRAKIKSTNKIRLCVHKTPRHIYAQIITTDGSKVLMAVNTLQSDVKSNIKYPGNIIAAQYVGKTIAEKAKAAGITQVAFDRSGHKYHGRIKSLADAARENGLEF